MTTFYIDPESGSDSNDGMTFANRWKTFASGATNARIAPGDTIRVIASRDPVSLGDATWTDNSTAITLATARTANVSTCETAWTASANVTCTTQTSGRKEGSYYVRAAVASGFTTGKIAYLPVTLDLSSYQQISLWFKSSTSVAAGVLQLRLCSDATGDTPVHTMALPNGTIPASGTGWQIGIKDFGAALSSGINSISLYAVSDPGTTSIDLDNIIACLAPANANCLTHLSLIGKKTAGEPEWYPLLSINDAALVLGCYNLTAVDSAARPYRGTTETVATYANNPLIDIDSTASTKRSVLESGTVDLPITFSGGWDRTAMSAQSGETWWSGSYNSTYIFAVASVNYITTEKFGICHGLTGGVDLSGFYHTHDFVGFVGNTTPITMTSGICALSLAVGNTTHNYSGLKTNSGAQITEENVRISARRIEGTVSGSACQLGSDPVLKLPAVIDIAKIDNNPYGFDFCGSATLKNTVFQNNTTNDIRFYTNAGVGVCEDTAFTIDPSVSSSSSFPNMSLRFKNYNQTSGDHRSLSGSSICQTDSTIRHTDSGVSWKISGLQSVSYYPSVNKRAPYKLKLATFAVVADALVTCSAWVRRSNTAHVIGLIVHRGQIAGVTSDVSAQASGTADTWEEIALTFTPTETGVVELYAYSYAASSATACWIDDLAIEQA